MVAGRLVVSLGQCCSSYCCGSHGLDSSQTDQTDRTPVVIARPGTGRLLSLSQGEERAGWPHPHPENIQEVVGRGCADYCGGGLNMTFCQKGTGTKLLIS
jgi:hypothetical protein